MFGGWKREDRLTQLRRSLGAGPVSFVIREGILGFGLFMVILWPGMSRYGSPY